MSNLQAAVGLAQLERLEETVAKKRLIGRWYEGLLGNLNAIERAPVHLPYAENIWWVYGVVLSDSFPLDAPEVMNRLATREIDTRPFFWPMHEQPVFRKMGLFNDVSCPVAERLARRGFYLPSGVALTRQQAERVATALREALS